MRTFVAIDLPETIRAEIRNLTNILRPLAGNLRWSRVAGLHITLKFIGEAPESKVEEVKRRLAGLLPIGPFPIAVRGSGYFPSLKRPRVFWVGIDCGPELERLARLIDKELQGLGIPAETRPYSPHLTLARIDGPVNLERLQGALTRMGPLDFGTFTAQEFFLYQSQPAKGGSIYTKLCRFVLNSELAEPAGNDETRTKR